MIRADGREGDKLGSALGYQPMELSVELGDLLGEGLVKRRATTERRANLVASCTPPGFPPGRKRAARVTSSFVERPRRRRRSASGAVTSKP